MAQTAPAPPRRTTTAAVAPTALGESMRYSREAHRRSRLVDTLPLIVGQVLASAVPFFLTIALLYLLSVRFDRTPLPSCRRSFKSDVLHTYCGLPDWHPRGMAYLPSWNAVLVMSGHSSVFSVPPQADASPSLFSVIPLDDARHIGPHMLHVVWPTGRPQDFASASSNIGMPSCREPQLKQLQHLIAMSVFEVSPSVWRLAVLSSASSQRSAVDLFDLQPGSAALTAPPIVTWTGCVSLPASGVNGHAPTGITLINESAFIVSAGPSVGVGWGGFKPYWHYIQSWISSQPAGGLAAWSRTGGWVHTRQAAGMTPSDVLYHDGYLAFTDQSRGRVCSFAYSPEAAATAKCTRLGGMPAAMGISRFARHSIYVVTWNDPWLVHLCILANMRGCHDAWSVQEINLKTYELRNVTSHAGTTYGAVTSIVDSGEVVAVGSPLADRIAFWFSCGPKAGRRPCDPVLI